MDIENVIKNLHPDCDASSANFAAQLITDAVTYFQGPVDYSKLDLNLGLTFQAENEGLLIFLRRKICVKPFENAKLEIFRLITWLLQQYSMKAYVLPFCGRFKTICWTYSINKNESAKAQQAALDSLITLFEKFGTDLDMDNFDPNIMYHTLCTEVDNSKFAPSVRGKMVHLLGVVASLLGPKYFDKEESFRRLFEHLNNILERQVISANAKMEANIILGVLKGMNSALFTLGTKIRVDSDYWRNFYDKLEKIVNPELSIVNTNPENKKLKRREFQRAGLELIGNHGSSNYFSETLYRNYKNWYQDLLDWSSSRNADDSRVGKKAMFTFLNAITMVLKCKGDNEGNDLEEENDNEEKEFQEKLLHYFIGSFNKSLDNKDCSRSELMIAIKGAGILINACPDQNIADKMFSKVMKHIESIVTELNMPVADKYSGSMNLITTYLESIGSMIGAIKISDEDSLLSFQQGLITVEQLSLLLILNFPDLNEKTKPFSHLSFLQVAQNLHSKHNKYFIQFMEHVFHESLNQIIASPTKLEIDIIRETLHQSDDNTTNTKALKPVTVYTAFWEALMKMKSEVTEAMYDIVMKWTLSTINKLDLTLEFVEDSANDTNGIQTNSADPIYNTKPNVIRDFQLFVNLVEFLQSFVLKSDAKLFAKWIEFYLEDMLGYLSTNPLVSGFYKMLTIVFKICDKIHYFENEDLPERKEWFDKCIAYLKTLCVRIEEFRDELLFSALELWLSAPDKIIMTNLNSLYGISKTVFIMGRNHFPLALRGIETVDRWFRMSQLPVDEMEKLAQSLFPTWKSYFISAGTELATIHKEKEKRFSTKSRYKNKAGQWRLKRAMEEFDDPTLKNVQIRILQLFGSYGHLLQLNEGVQNALATEEKYLKYSLPFSDIKPDLYLDSFLPRVLELCHTAGDRQTRSSACEFFHTMVLYFLGYSVKLVASSEHDDLFRKIFTALLKLGCDSDVIVRQLFNPLSIQVVHWFTRKDNPYSENMLQIIMDGLTQSTDSPLRDFCGVCLSEYFGWCVKHNNEVDLNRTMKYLFALSTHAAPQYRQGSVLGFNSIYKGFREDDNLRNVYSIHLLYSYVTSLSLSKTVGADGDTILIRSTLQAIKHLERILLKKKDLFNTEMKHRKKPQDLGGYKLQNLVDWIFRQTGRLETICREECIRLVSSLAPAIRGMGTLEHYIRTIDIEEIKKIGNYSILDKDIPFSNALCMLARTTDYYSFLAKDGYPMQNVLMGAEITYFQDLGILLQKTVEDFDPTVGTMAINIYCKLQPMITHIPDELHTDIIIHSVKLSKMFASEEQTAQLCKLWALMKPSAKVIEICSANFKLDFQTVSTNRVLQILRVIRWMVVIAKEGFFQAIVDKKEVSALREQIWDFVNKMVFQQQKDGDVDTVSISLRMTEMLQRMFELCVVLDFEGEKLIEYLFDPTIVTNRIAKRQHKVTKGEVLQNVLLPSLLFCENMTNFGQLKEKVSMEKVGNLAQNLLGVVKSKRELRKRFGDQLVESILSIWTSLQLNCDRRIVSRVLCGLASINLNLCRNSIQVSQWWTSIISASYLGLREKSEMFNIFGLFALSSNQLIVNNVLSSANMFVKTNFAKYMKWSEEESYITRIAVKILAADEQIPKNLQMVELLARLVAQISNLSDVGDTDNVCIKEIRYKLRKTVLGLAEKGHDIVDRLYQLIINKDETDFRTTLAACRFCLIPSISALPTKIMKKFYKQNIYDIIRQSRLTPTTVEEWNCKTIAFYMLEILALKIDGEFLSSKDFDDSYIAQCSESEKVEKENKVDKAALKHIIKTCSSFKTSPTPTQRDDKLRRANFQCNCASFNALSAVIKASTQNENFYSVYLFKEKPGELIWANLVDSTVLYNFPVLLPQHVTQKVDLKISTDKVKLDDSEEKKLIMSKEINVNNKNGLVGSSLAMEATEFDFTNAVTVENCEFYKGLFSGVTGKSSDKKSSTAIEWNEINEHDCMISLVEIIRYMKNYDTALDAEGGLVKDKWITHLYNCLQKSPHRNIKIFLIGAILNCEQIIRPYAKHFIEPILETVLSGCFGDEKLNYFVKDVLILLLGFKDDAKPCSSSVKKILEYVISDNGFESTPYATRKDVYDHNLEILQSIVKFWVSDPENELPMEMFSGKKIDVDKKYLDFCKHILLGGQLPININDVAIFMDGVCKGMKSGSKNVYSVTGDVIGLSLKILADKGYEHIHKARSLVKSKLDLQTSRHSAFLIILSNIQKYYTPFIEMEKQKVLELLRNANVRVEAILLLPALLTEIIRVSDTEVTKKAVEDFYTELYGKNIFATPCQDESEIKAGVEIFKLLLNNIDNDKLMKLVEWTSSAVFNKDGKLRSEYVKVLSEVYSRIPGSQQGLSLSPSHKLLLKMFANLYTDEDPLVKEQVHKFWSENLQRWNKSSELILELMELIGDDENSVSISLELIMKRCSLSPDFKKLIFDQPLEDIPFQEYKLDTSWRMKNSSFQPLFAESLSSSQNFSTLPRAFQSSIMSQRQGTGMFGMNLLRATLANLQFTPTKQSSLDDSVPDMMEVDYTFSQDESLELVHEGSPDQSLNPLASLRKRFYERPNTGTDYFAMRETEKQNRKIEGQLEKLKHKRSGVQLSRSYRIGELPDIEMTNTQLLATLTTLTRVDQQLGRQFLVVLYTSIVKEMGDSRSRKTFLENSEITFNNVFKNYFTMMSPQFAAAVLEMGERNNIRIQPNLVTNVSKNFDLQKLGILKLENDLERQEAEIAVPTSSKRSKSSHREENLEADLWLRMADMYKEIEEFDVLRNIFSAANSKSINASDIYKDVKQALTLESVGKLENACDMYEDILFHEQNDTENHSVVREQFWEDCITKCLSKMSEWEKCYEKVHKSTRMRSISDLLDDSSYIERILPLQITSGVQIVLRDQSETENKIVSKFKDFIANARESSDNWKLLLERFPVDLAILTAAENSEAIAQCGSLVDATWSSALKYIQNFDRLSYCQRKEQILMLQKSAALQDILDWHRYFDITKVEDKTTRLVTKWRRSCASVSTPLYNADLIVAQKDFFLLKLGHEVDDLMLEAKDQLFSEIQMLNFHQHLWVLKLGCINENFSVTQNAFAKLQTVGQTLGENEKIQWRKLYASHLSIFRSAIRSDEWAKMWSSVWKKSQKIQVSEMDSVWEVQAELLRNLFEFSENEGNDKSYDGVFKAALMGKEKRNSLIEEAVNRSVNLVNSTMEDNQMIKSEGLCMKFHHLLRYILDRFPEKYSEDVNLNKQLVCSLLRGMQLGSSEGIRIFPSVFTILEKIPAIIADFEEMVLKIPCWMLLPWLDQIVTAYYHTPALSSMFEKIIEVLVAEYPQAFQLQYPEILARSKHSQLYNDYSKALSALVLPQIRFKEMSQRLRQSKPERLIILLEQFQEDLQEILDLDMFYGSIHRKYALEMFPKVLRYLNTGAETQDTQKSQSEILEDIFNFCDKMENSLRSTAGVKSLADFSPWMYKFHFSGFTEGIEIPGLYDKFSAPNTEMHPQLIAFHPTVTIENSITKPVSFKMLSNDGKEYKFLAKFGDDLRQDRRIQQCFRLSNEIFKENPKCRDRKLNISTYSVIPFSEKFGIIQWVQNTISMKRIIFSTKSSEGVNRRDVQTFMQWLQNKNIAPNYHNLAKNASREVATSVFDKCVKEFNSLSTQKFREFFKERAASLEDYFLIRENVIRSYSTMCLVHWLLGIGDRHLENFLFSLDTGLCVGIDFGHSFGSTINNLSIPELIPFRLTPQLQNILAPYGVKGLFKETMIYAWRALRRSSEQILSVVEVFVKDKGVKWLEDRRKTKQDSELPIAEESQKMISNQIKVEIVKQKLSCVNPIQITETQLKQHRQTSIIPLYTNILKDGRESLANKTNLNEEDVVDILLDIATDKNILIRTYVGWSSWI